MPTTSGDFNALAQSLRAIVRKGIGVSPTPQPDMAATPVQRGLTALATLSTQFDALLAGQSQATQSRSESVTVVTAVTAHLQ